MDRLDPIRQKVKDARIETPPVPWRHITTAPIGGLTEVGFADDSELLLVLSHQGRGIFDGVTGAKLARDANESRTDWYGRDQLTARGFGPLAGQDVRLCGLWGGGLPTYTRDYWRAQSVTLQWPEQHLLLIAPQANLFQPGVRFWKLAVEHEVRAFGFSHTGKTLVIATNHDLTIIGREGAVQESPLSLL